MTTLLLLLIVTIKHIPNVKVGANEKAGLLTFRTHLHGYVVFRFKGCLFRRKRRKSL